MNQPIACGAISCGRCTAAVVHGGGAWHRRLYRLCVKWGWPAGKDAAATRRNLKVVKWTITVFFLALGLATLAAYIKIGIEHQPRYGERYVPASSAAPETP
jgi:fumarate reductase subunit C